MRPSVTGHARLKSDADQEDFSMMVMFHYCYCCIIADYRRLLVIVVHHYGCIFSLFVIFDVGYGCIAYDYFTTESHDDIDQTSGPKAPRSPTREVQRKGWEPNMPKHMGIESRRVVRYSK